MAPRGMKDAIPIERYINDQGDHLYHCALCTRLFKTDDLYWTFYRSSRKWMYKCRGFSDLKWLLYWYLWVQFTRDRYDPCYSYACYSCREGNKEVDKDFVPPTLLTKTIGYYTENGTLTLKDTEGKEFDWPLFTINLVSGKLVFHEGHPIT